ncbi:alpha/beta fold hydrolase [Paracoccaceae bacterium GXU_MW_L88]
MSFVTTKDGVNLEVRDWGEGPVILLIHGWPLSCAMWEWQQNALVAEGFRVVSYTRRGFGGSDKPGGGYDYDTMSDDTRAVIDALSLKDITLAGFSMGGGEVARYMARHQGHGAARCIFISAVTPFLLQTEDNPEGVPGDVFADIGASIEKDRLQHFRDFGPTFYGNGEGTGGVSDGVLEWTRGLAYQASKLATLACAKAFAETDFRDDLKGIDKPTLFIHGDADQVVPMAVSAERAVKLVEGATLTAYEGAPHGLYATHADRLTKDIADFARG